MRNVKKGIGGIMEMIKFLDPPEDVKPKRLEEWEKCEEIAPPFPQVLSGSAYNLVSNPCKMTSKQLRKYASLLI